MARAAGVVDIHADAMVHVYPPGHNRRPILRDFINNLREKLIEGGFIERSILDGDLAVLEQHLAVPKRL